MRGGRLAHLGFAMLAASLAVADFGPAGEPLREAPIPPPRRRPRIEPVIVAEVRRGGGGARERARRLRQMQKANP